MLVATVYVGTLIAQPPRILGEGLRTAARGIQRSMQDLVADGLKFVGVAEPTFFQRHGTFLLVFGMVVPWLVATVLGRGRPGDLGLRAPSPPAGRLLALSVVISLPFLLWMVLSPGIANDYVPQFRRGALGALGYYFANMSSEHFLLHGLLLAFFRPGWRWPAGRPPFASPSGGRLTRALRWIGLAQPLEGARGASAVVRWFGLPADCVPAVVGSGLLFGLVHVGKDPRELLLSVPGGFASAYLAYRTGTMFMPFALHMTTAGLALLMMFAFG